MTVEELYIKRKNDPQWNTSYPLSPKDWASFRVDRPLSFKEDKELSFYVHIPFCRQCCSFCEYTRMICPSEQLQTKYLETLRKDISLFRNDYSDFMLRGVDIGGGTPTSISEDNFNRLMDVYDEAVEGLVLSDEFEPSIEGTFQTLSESKLKRMAQSKIHRLSLGLQTTNNDVLGRHHRKGAELAEMTRWMEKAWSAGVCKINLDLMYGLQGQNRETIINDLKSIAELRPQQVTLYELRTNMISYKDISTKDTLFEQYSEYYEGLISLGYHASFGQNTFSLDEYDCGVSSYLRSRMLHGVSYKGFGLSAQSMSFEGVAYNVGKSSHYLKELILSDSYHEEFTYILPQRELAAKYIAIAAYNCSFSLDRVSTILGTDAREYYHDELDFALSHGYMKEDPVGRIRITKDGFKHYGAIFSLFYAKN